MRAGAGSGLEARRLVTNWQDKRSTAPGDAKGRQ